MDSYNRKITKLSNANLQGAQLQPLTLVQGRTIVTDMSNASLRYANLSGATLRELNLRGADLSYANLLNADLTGADLQGANFEGARLNPSQQALLKMPMG